MHNIISMHCTYFSAKDSPNMINEHCALESSKMLVFLISYQSAYPHKICWYVSLAF